MEGTQTIDSTEVGDLQESGDLGNTEESNELSEETLLGIENGEEVAEETEEEAAPPKTYKMRVKGEDVELTEDELRETFKIKPETEITEDVANVLLSAKNLELAARQAFSEATSAQKQVTAFMDILTKDPMSLLTDPRMPFNFEDLAIDFIAEKLRLEQMTPAERRALELEKENKRYREEKEKENSEKSKQQFEQETEQHMNSFANDIVSAMEEAGLPETKFVFQRFAFHMNSLARQAKAEGYPNYIPTAKDVLPLVKQELEETISHLGKKAKPEDLVKALGDEGRKKIRELELARVSNKKNAAPKREAVPGNSERKSKDMNQKMNIEQFRKMMDEKMGPL